MAFDPNDPDTKAALKAAIEEAVSEAKTGLETKNKELLAELKEARKGKTIDPSEVERLEGKIDELTGKLTAAEKQAKDSAKAAETATKALEKESGFTHKLVAENGVMKALADAGVTDPAYLEAAKAMHISNVKIVAEGDDRKAMYGDKELAVAIKEWAGGDVGKKFVSAPNNGGGGAPGGKGGEGVKTVTRQQFDALEPQARVTFAKEGGKVVDAAA